MPKPLDIRGNSFSWHSLDQQSLNLRTLDVQVQPARKFHIKSASNKRPGLHGWSQLVFNLHSFIYTWPRHTSKHVYTQLHTCTHTQVQHRTLCMPRVACPLCLFSMRNGPCPPPQAVWELLRHQSKCTVVQIWFKSPPHMTIKAWSAFRHVTRSV